MEEAIKEINELISKKEIEKADLKLKKIKENFNNKEITEKTGEINEISEILNFLKMKKNICNIVDNVIAFEDK